MRIICDEMSILEIDGKKVDGGTNIYKVLSYPSDPGKIILSINDTSFTIKPEELAKAIEKCTK